VWDAAFEILTAWGRARIPIKNGYQLESLCPNVILAFFPCASYIRHASVCSKVKCMKMQFFSVSFIFAIVAIDAQGKWTSVPPSQRELCQITELDTVRADTWLIMGILETTKVDGRVLRGRRLFSVLASELRASSAPCWGQVRPWLSCGRWTERWRTLRKSASAAIWSGALRRAAA
jgi:hypothetical protein